jgi:phosphohistidine phosphatase SixA
MARRNDQNALIRLIIVRHGETTANALNILQGQSLDPSYKLTEMGALQAQAVGRALREEKWWKVVCSDLPRTRETVYMYTIYSYVHITLCKATLVKLYWNFSSSASE